MGCNYSSFCSAPSDGQSSRQQGASTSTSSPDWLSLLAKAHWIGWASGGRSRAWPVALPEELPFSCCDTVPVPSVGPAGRPIAFGSSLSFGGLVEGGDVESVYKRHWEGANQFWQYDENIAYFVGKVMCWTYLCSVGGHFLHSPSSWYNLFTPSGTEAKTIVEKEWTFKKGLDTHT